METNSLSCPEFLAMERTIIDDFVACTRESCAETEICVKALDQGGSNDHVHRLFRALHSLKGNCQMVGLTPFTEPLHKVEDIVAKIRSNQIPYAPAVGEFLLLACDEIEDLLAELINTRQTNNARRLLLCEVSSGLLSRLNPFNVVPEFQQAILQLDKKDRNIAPESKSRKILLEVPPDLELMRNLSEHIDNLSIYRKNRSDQVVQMTEQLNQALGLPVDPVQLQAASLMHDVGMSFIPHNIFNKEGSLSKEELRKIQEHVVIGSQFLLRFGGWEQAARMVLDHHERFDGSGYPNGAKAHQIHPGGRMLAIVDTFCSITTERSDRTFKKSLLSAISEINANSDTQFDPDMVQVFNDVVRKIMLRPTT
ncbi:HD-GYP domain-containing protein [Undibacterium fentianense]|uniref:HD domain-containing protein n=1 Tax=Undibacterium fentianense TaxID=2828728 RepID=A0A941ICP7_9BURK|nr:HD domain-containing phosphohydrolase [Undibacterium fentianense]MBR7799113.1 HD domain-containing protein [Undibacterium fentianense]